MLPVDRQAIPHNENMKSELPMYDSSLFMDWITYLHS